ncbi:MAG: hypothetical protein V1871_04590 [Planctomycetota bacterium]
MKKVFNFLIVIGLFIIAYICWKYHDEIRKDWYLYSTLILASIAIFQDPIKRWWNKPILVFTHKETSPFRRENTLLIEPTLTTSKVLSTYECFMVENNGRGSALQCRCQIREVRQNGKSFGCYRGYPLHWARRPDAEIDPLKAERLNIGPGESEFLDLCFTASIDSDIHLAKYHTIPIGIPDFIPSGVYEVKLIFSGDNFKPYFIVFEIKKDNSANINSISVKLIKYWQG